MLYSPRVVSFNQNILKDIADDDEPQSLNFFAANYFDIAARRYWNLICFTQCIRVLAVVTTEANLRVNNLGPPIQEILMEVVSTVTISAFIAIGVSWFIMTLVNKKKEITYLAIQLRANELEKQIHINEVKYLEQTNNQEIAYRDEQKSQRNLVRLEGYEDGLVVGKKDYLIELATLRSEYKEKILEERNLAATEARSHARAEFEQQSKLFSVVIRPYLKIEKDDGIIWDSHKSSTGYQYQLLINGIPAFQPHVVVEQTSEIKEYNEAKLKSLMSVALEAAKAAAEIYLSGVSNSVLKMGAPIIEEITRSKALKASS